MVFASKPVMRDASSVKTRLWEETFSLRMTWFGPPRSLSMRGNDLEASSFKSKRSMKSSPLFYEAGMESVFLFVEARPSAGGVALMIGSTGPATLLDETW